MKTRKPVIHSFTGVDGIEYVCEYRADLELEFCEECGVGAHAHHHYQVNPHSTCKGCYGDILLSCEECEGTGYTISRFAEIESASYTYEQIYTLVHQS